MENVTSRVVGRGIARHGPNHSIIDFKESVHTTGGFGIYHESKSLFVSSVPLSNWRVSFLTSRACISRRGQWLRSNLTLNFKEPFREDVEAAVTSPEIAVREVLFWTDDIFECREIALAHRRASREVFDEWMQLYQPIRGEPGGIGCRD